MGSSSACKLNDEVVPHEGLPLLLRPAKHGSERHKNSSLPLFLFGMATIAFFAHMASIQWHRTSNFLSEHDRHTQDSQWWQTSNRVSTTTTHLSGLVYPPPTRLGQRQLRWGVLGLGRIAQDFTAALILTGANVTAVAAGSLPNASLRAKHFAERYNVPTSYGTYQEMAQDPNVDIVYIATINTLHYEPAKQMLQAGKNVLLEKPMTMHLEEAQHLADIAKEANLLLLTNFWTRLFPVLRFVRSFLSNQHDRLGPITSMRGDFGFPAPPNPQDRFLNRSSGGGAMLDVGCYLINLAVLLRGQHPDVPSQLQAMAQRRYLGTQYEVDTETAFQFDWEEKAPLMVSGQASFTRPSSFEVELEFWHGRIVLHGPANAATAATIYEHEPMGPLKHVELVSSELPVWDHNRFGPENYPRGAGFAYVIHEIEQCMSEHGIPGESTRGGGSRPGCIALEQLTMDEQLLTVAITETILQDAGYWDWSASS
jgi:predicted dehydrogenase